MSGQPESSGGSDVCCKEGCGKERNCLGSTAEPEELSAPVSGRAGMQTNRDEMERNVNPELFCCHHWHYCQWGVLTALPHCHNSMQQEFLAAGNPSSAPSFSSLSSPFPIFQTFVLTLP